MAPGPAATGETIEPAAADDTAEADETEEPPPLLAAAPSEPNGSGGRSPADAFWSTPADAADLPVTFRAPPVDALALKLLGAPPFQQEWPDFTAAAEAAYQAIGERALRLASEGSS